MSREHRSFLQADPSGEVPVDLYVTVAQLEIITQTLTRDVDSIRGDFNGLKDEIKDTNDKVDKIREAQQANTLLLQSVADRLESQARTQSVEAVDKWDWNKIVKEGAASGVKMAIASIVLGILGLGAYHAFVPGGAGAQAEEEVIHEISE